MIRMSVSDPLIKDIKGCTLILFKEFQDTNEILDSNETLLKFCQISEKIFYKGLIYSQNTFYGGNKRIDGPLWMFNIEENNDYSSFTYKHCLEEVRNCKSVNTSLGRFRLLFRHCLVKKCIHIPLEILNHSRKIGLFYDKTSILGDEILSAILLSVLLQCNKINFKLQLDNSSFLDLSWQLPDFVKLELVPCKNLGISISFCDNKAVIVHIRPNSVAFESGEIGPGDILTNLNGVEITSSCKGRLNAILRINKGRPINLIIIKAFKKGTQDIFPPIKSILKKLQFDLSQIKSEDESENLSDFAISKCSKSGYPATYLGFVDVGNKGSVKQIEEAIKHHLTLSKETTDKEKAVIFEIGEMSVKILDVEDDNIIFKHSYMQISSCGSAPNFPNYIAYIAGDETCDTASKFICYIFHVKNTEDAYTILQSIDERNLLISEDPNIFEVSGIVSSLTTVEVTNMRDFEKELFREKQKLIDNFTQLIESVTSMKQLDAAKKACISLGPTLKAIATKQKLGKPGTSVRSSSPSNKKITPQRGKLHSTKKKSSKAVNLVTPTNDEMQAIATKALSK